MCQRTKPTHKLSYTLEKDDLPSTKDVVDGWMYCSNSL